MQARASAYLYALSTHWHSSTRVVAALFSAGVQGVSLLEAATDPTSTTPPAGAETPDGSQLFGQFNRLGGC